MKTKKKVITFLGYINVTSTINDKYEFKVQCIKAITKIHLKPTS